MANSYFYISELFDVVSGKTTNLYTLSRGNTPFVAASDKNNGVTAYIQDSPTFQKNLITVSRNGSVCEAFFQPQPFCASLDDIRVLIPKNFDLDSYTGLYICTLIKLEKFRYNYGRKFGTIRIKETKILLPDKGGRNVDWDLIRKISKGYLQNTSSLLTDIFNGKYSFDPLIEKKYALNTENWESFSLSELFDIKKGKRLTKEDMEEGDTPFVGAIDSNNGWSASVGQLPIFEGNVITVNYDGNGVAEAYFQPVPFWALDSVNVLYPKFQLNQFIALFICTIIQKEKYRFSYGRKWNQERMQNSEINLPAKNGKPDFLFMENYIKSLPYSSAIMKEVNYIKPKSNSKPKKANTGLSDEELIKKYDTGKSVNFDTALKNMGKTPSPTTLSKQKK